ncbi:hypothetical protein F4808DRAFT_394042 [Astrocystis sublimbata]|nr:hypothetical protein F4808DRAFT_394042 [Astrocystis sublimbata]
MLAVFFSCKRLQIYVICQMKPEILDPRPISFFYSMDWPWLNGANTMLPKGESSFAFRIWVGWVQQRALHMDYDMLCLGTQVKQASRVGTREAPTTYQPRTGANKREAQAEMQQRSTYMSPASRTGSRRESGSLLTYTRMDQCRLDPMQRPRKSPMEDQQLLVDLGVYWPGYGNSALCMCCVYGMHKNGYAELGEVVVELSEMEARRCGRARKSKRRSKKGEAERSAIADYIIREVYNETTPE